MTDSLRVLYEIRADAGAAEALASGIALEQSVELPAHAIPAEITAAGIPGVVESLTAVDEGCWHAWVRSPVANTGFEIAQFLNVLFGNTSMQMSVTLIDAELPPSLLAAFAGPSLGMPGLRDLLQAPQRALTLTALKPMGHPPARLAALADRFARAGIDIIKEDHGIATQSYAPFAERVRLCQQAVERAAQETGRLALYAPNITGTPATLRAQLDAAQAAGVRAIMAAPMLIGLPAFVELASQAAGAGMAVLAHPALSGALRIALDFLFGKLYRLIGADAVIFVNYGGRFGWPQHVVRRLAANLRAPWGSLRPSFPSPAGGMTLERVPEMISFFGTDVVLLISGALYPEDGLDARTRAFVEAAADASARTSQEESPP